MKQVSIPWSYREQNDANRASLGTRMQRQVVSLIAPAEQLSEQHCYHDRTSFLRHANLSLVQHHNSISKGLPLAVRQLQHTRYRQLDDWRQQECMPHRSASPNPVLP